MVLIAELLSGLNRIGAYLMRMRSPQLLLNLALVLVPVLGASADDAHSPVPESLNRLSIELGMPWTFLLKGSQPPLLKVADWPDVADEVAITCEQCISSGYRPKRDDIGSRLILVPSNEKNSQDDIVYLSYRVDDKLLTMFQTARIVGLITPGPKPSEIKSNDDAAAIAMGLIKDIYTRLPSGPRWDTKVTSVKAAHIVAVEVTGEGSRPSVNYWVLLHDGMAVVVFHKGLGSLGIPGKEWFYRTKLSGEDRRFITKCRVQFPKNDVEFWAGQVNEWHELVLNAGDCPIESVQVVGVNAPFKVEVVEKEKSLQFVIRIMAAEVTANLLKTAKVEITFKNGGFNGDNDIRMRTRPSKGRDE